MNEIFLIVVITYVVAIIGISLWRGRGVKGQDDFMVAGRSVPAWLLVGTLVCTWIGAGSLIGGGGRAFRGGLSQLWMSAGAWLGILIIFFLADRVRRISKYTVQDILELRYHPAARVLGAIVVIVGSMTIFSYQLRGGAFVLEYILRLEQSWGLVLTAAVIVLFTMIAGLRSIVAVDILNGILIILAVFIGLPLMLGILGGGDVAAGVDHVTATLPQDHFSLFGSQDVAATERGTGIDFVPQSRAAAEASAEGRAVERNPFLGMFWAMGVFFPTFFLLLGESSIYQKFYSAKDDRSARRAVVGFLVGVTVIEIALAFFAVTCSSAPEADVWRRSYDDFCKEEVLRAKTEVAIYDAGRGGRLSPEAHETLKTVQAQRAAHWDTFVKAVEPETGALPALPDYDPSNPRQYIDAAYDVYSTRTDSINLFAAFHLLPPWAGMLLMAGGLAIIISTGNSFMMAASTSFARDIWQRFLRPKAGAKEMVRIQRFTMIVLAVIAVVQLTLLRETVWQMALAAYTLIGAGLTPVILAAFLWKRVTPAGGVASVAAGLGTWAIVVALKITGIIQMDYDFIIYPAAGASILALIVFSLITKPSPPEVYKPFMAKPKSERGEGVARTDAASS